MTENDSHTIKIANGVAQNLGRVQNRTLNWADLVDRLSKPKIHSDITVDQYAAFSKSAKNDTKADAGFFLAGHCSDGIRRNAHIDCRSLITLDADDLIDDELYVQLKSGQFEDLEFESFAHTTRSHSPDAPRFRILIPLSDPITDPDAYVAAARLVASRIDPTMESWDPCSFRPAQMMYLPSISSDQEFIAKRMRGELCDWEMILEECDGDWRDIANLPRSETEKSKIRKSARVASKTSGRGGVLSDPGGKGNMVGAFCRAYPIEAAMATFIPGVYEPADVVNGEQRYTYAAGSSVNGGVILGGTHLYSHHATDPAGEQAHNAWDIVRIHRFGHLDEFDSHSVSELESHKAMQELAMNDMTVMNELSKSAAQADEFDVEIETQGGGQDHGDDPINDLEVFFNDEAPADVECGSAGADLIGDDLMGMIDEISADEGDDDTPDQAPSGVRTSGLFSSLAAEEAAGIDASVAQNIEDDDDDGEWMEMIARDKNGRSVKSQFNVNLILANDRRINRSLMFNEFTNQIAQKSDIVPGVSGTAEIVVRDRLLGDPMSEAHIDVARSILSAPTTMDGYDIQASEADVKSGIRNLGNLNAFHPVKDLLEAVEWDGVPRVETLFVDHLGAEDNAYHRETATKVMMAAVARIYQPGCFFDALPIIEGATGSRKTSFVRALSCGFTSTLKDDDMVDTQRAREKMGGAWILEIPELSAMKGRDAGRLKTFISELTDKVRMAYAVSATDVPRQAIFIGTIDRAEYLEDLAGNRRYWPIKVGVDVIDIDALTDMLPQLWAEAKVLYEEAASSEGGLKLFLQSKDAITYAAKLQSSRMKVSQESMWADDIREALLKTYSRDDGWDLDGCLDEAGRIKFVSLKFIWSVLLGHTLEEFLDRRVQNAFANVVGHIRGIEKGVSPAKMELPISSTETSRTRYYVIDHDQLEKGV